MMKTVNGSIPTRLIKFESNSPTNEAIIDDSGEASSRLRDIKYIITLQPMIDKYEVIAKACNAL